MTNQNTALREHEPPTDPERLRASHLLQKGDQLDANTNNNNNSTSAPASTTPPASVALKNSLNANPGLSVSASNLISNTSSNHNSNSTGLGHKSSPSSSSNKRPASRSSHHHQEVVEGARETSSAPFPLYQPYNTLFGVGAHNNSHNSGGSGLSGSAGGPERCHTTSPVGTMHHHKQQRLMSPTSPYYNSGSSRLMKNTRDMHNMLHKRPLSADGGASEAKRSPRLVDRMRLHSPSSHDGHRGRDEDEDEMEGASDMRMTATDEDRDREDEEERERLRDTKRNIKLLHHARREQEEEHSSRDRDRPRSTQSQQQQNLESGE